MRLSELCEPLFLYICRLNRSARKGGMIDFNRARNEIKAILEDMARSASTDPRLSDQFRKVELPLLFFVDSMLSESTLAIAAEWNANRLAAEKHELAGDEKFFDLLDEALADSSEQAGERLEIFYTCLGLGFTGWYAGQNDYLRKKTLEVSARIPSLIGIDDSARICPEAYQYNDTRDLVETPGRKLVGIGIALVGLVIVVAITNVCLFKWTSDELVDVLGRILSHGRQESPSGESP